MDALEKAGYLAPGTRKTLLSNTLVIVVPFDGTLKIHSAADLAGGEVQKIAISQPSSVPVGIYSKEYLTKLGLWDKLAPKVVPTQNVRACSRPSKAATSRPASFTRLTLSFPTR